MKLIYYKRPGDFLIAATINDLLALLDHGFYICRLANAYTPKETYVSLSKADLNDLWNRLRVAPPSYQAARIWDAHYLTTQANGSPLAGVISAECSYIRRRWSFHIALHWGDSPLPRPAFKLIEMARPTPVYEEVVQ